MSLPLSDSLSGRDLRLAGAGLQAARASVDFARHFLHELELKELARTDFENLYRSGRFDWDGPGSPCWQEDIYDPEERKRLIDAWLGHADFCVSQEEIDQALARGDRHIRCYSKQEQEFQVEPTASCRLLVLGNARVEAIVGPQRLDICLYQQSRAYIEVIEASLGTLAVSFQESEVIASGAMAVHCYDNSSVRPKNKNAYAFLNDQSRCLLGQASTVMAKVGTSVVAGADAVCRLIELGGYDRLNESEETAWLLDSNGEILLEGRSLPYGEEWQRGELRVVNPVPF